jgi:membrane-bound lytic murein transglycosylase
MAALLAFTASSCAYAPSHVPQLRAAAEPHLVAVDTAECRALLRDDGSVESLRQSITRSIDYLEHLRPSVDRSIPTLGRLITPTDLLNALQITAGAFRESSDATIGSSFARGNGQDEETDPTRPQQLCERLHLYRVGLPEPVLVTGYYQPDLPASRTHAQRFRYPVYRTPDNLIDVELDQFCPACSGRVAQGRVRDGKLVPYYTRAEIDAGALAGKDYEIAWLDDPVEAFFLHVQGSALLRFDDGVQMQISYSSSNGRPYTSIGRVLIEQGKMSADAVSLTSLKGYLRAHPEEQADIMAMNQRYIFFRPVITGPIGSLGVPLTGGRSIAADPAVYPPGALVFLRIGPRDAAAADTPPAFSRFAVIQDTGTAVTGANHVDVYWGSGATAEALAGDMRNPGELYLVLP